MALYTPKTWQDRQSDYPNRRMLTQVSSGSNIYSVTRSEGTVSVEGDRFNADTMNAMEDRILAGFNAVSSQFSTSDETMQGYIHDVSINGRTVTVTKGNGIKTTLTTQDTTYTTMRGAGSSTAGATGLVPAPAAGNNTKFLRGDGTWQDPPSYSIATQSSNGLMSAADKTKVDNLGTQVTYSVSNGVLTITTK